MQNFEEWPPEYIADDKPPYNTIQNRSFVAMLNANTSATVDCAYFVCGKKTTTTTAAPTQGPSSTTTIPPETPSPPGPNGDTDGHEESSDNQKKAGARVRRGIGEATQSTEATTASGETGMDGFDEARGKVRAAKHVVEDAIGKAIRLSRQARRLSDSGNDSYVGGLVCVSYPPALTAGQKPFK